MKLLIRLVCEMMKGKQENEDQTIYRYTGEWMGKSGEKRGEEPDNWLQRLWCPLILCLIVCMALLGMLIEFSYRERNSRFWELVEVGLVGYMLGRHSGGGPELSFKTKKRMLG